MMINFLHALIAVLAGNGIYFLLAPYLPPAARDAATRVGPGTLIDFWICLMIFVTIKFVSRKSRQGKNGPHLP